MNLFSLGFYVGISSIFLNKMSIPRIFQENEQLFAPERIHLDMGCMIVLTAAIKLALAVLKRRRLGGDTNEKNFCIGYECAAS